MNSAFRSTLRCRVLVCLLPAVALAACTDALFGIDSGRPVLVETFEDIGSSFSNRLVRHRAITVVDGEGVDGSHAVRVTYHGSSRGSERVVATHSLQIRSKEATLIYDVKFCEGFKFVKGGKLHGLGPANTVTGGLEGGPEQWSARVIFRRDGGVGTYVYHQGRPDKYGTESAAPAFQFRPNQYYSISLYVHVNEPATAKNGYADIYVNGEKVASQNDIQFRLTDNGAALISKLLFNTFHGGHTQDFAPRKSDGSYTTECAYFDNFAVYPHLKIRRRPGR